MSLVIGIDEAGYGPNLGPLVIGGTLWRVPDSPDDLYELLHPVFSRPDESVAAELDCSLAIGDSKKLFSSGGSLQKLELPILSLLSGQGTRVSAADELFQCLAGIESQELHRQPGYDWTDLSLPIDTHRDGVRRWAVAIQEHFQSREVECCRLAARVVFPDSWNQGLDRCGNKASLLSVLSCQLVEELLRSIPESYAGEPVHIFCDKHGGRNHYAAVIQQEITSNFVIVRSESRERSVYSWSDDAGRPLEMGFAAKGESQLPVALASMIAKFLRELSMTAWNRFWQQHMPDLRPTAGYPVDARRFRHDIADVQKSLNIKSAAIWRVR